ncbi:uncharacterized protein HD556DRAFT_1411269 [Suillus plorans]|uniref:Uncharacterized protein n=1 Tax=Suillus plorans TaxID=116603 RepID=A0A9P7AFA9_9AGAM|nr:uncharacterized protein HD556DRAFT_1411269 [Suillus plorans]KAG1787095.1 hypothetical protein HD556DRAFT_1411269 [Suillus plorans]
MYKFVACTCHRFRQHNMMRYGDTLWAVSCACYPFDFLINSCLLLCIHCLTCFTSLIVLDAWIRIFLRRTWNMIAVVMLKAKNLFWMVSCYAGNTF